MKSRHGDLTNKDTVTIIVRNAGAVEPGRVGLLQPHNQRARMLIEFIAISALFATTSVIMSSIMGASRALFAMARQGVLPSRLALISRQSVPFVTVLITGIAIGAIVLITGGNIDWLASLFNFETLLTFFFINLSLLKLRKTIRSHSGQRSSLLYAK